MLWLYFLTSFILTAIILFILWKIGGIGKYVSDHNKPTPTPRKVAFGGGVAIILVTVSVYIIFEMVNRSDLYLTYSVVGMIIIAFFIGLYDDLKIIRKWKKVPILAIAALPIIITYFIAGVDLWPPTILGINFSIWYWILIVPIVVAGFANGGNVIAGYDGMETGIYTMIALLYFIIGYIINSQIIIMLSGILFFSLFAMLIYNWYPSKLILGNVGSFAISATIGIIPLIGHFEIVLPIVFAPHIIEVGLQMKYTRKLRYDVFGEVDKKGIIHNKYGIKSIIHWIISWGNMTEKKVTMAMLGIEALLCTVAFFVWYLLYFMF